ncbi:MAG: aldo/keto reductase [Eubacteriales bacterium]|nr:aldo/keto reductase [Eubacteriales bacterium]MDD3881168.1 aldo/keto reductase [Eubacteriales bacterium]MDD4511550.1 aldo/keto reductase [Eubacteriales bacterium]
MKIVLDGGANVKSITLGRTGITVPRCAFGALPIQRRSVEDAVELLSGAYDCGFRFFDTARAYSDSEEKLGLAFGKMRGGIIISTKTAASTPDGFWADLETSLETLKTDYIDIYQFHNPAAAYREGDGTGMYEAMLSARRQGMISYIGITNHRIAVAEEAVNSGLYDTLQFPFSYLSGEKEEALVRLCAEKNVGFLCMKALSGGLITNAKAAFAYLAQYENVLPLWGIQRESELRDFAYLMQEPAEMSDELMEVISHDRAELCGDFCRGCGYCKPCPAGIEIETCARMSLLLRRAPVASFTTPDMQKKMRRIEECRHCGACASRCPYSLDTPDLLKRNHDDFFDFLEQHGIPEAK